MSELTIPTHIRALIRDLAFVEDRDLRQQIVSRAMASMTKQDMGGVLIAFFELAEQVVENAEEHAIGLLMAEGGMHPHQAEKINFPSIKGAALGLEAAARITQNGCGRLCAGCAYRQGSIANQCLPTQIDAEWSLTSEDSFMCHINGYDEAADTPSQQCIGHIYASRGAA